MANENMDTVPKVCCAFVSQGVRPMPSDAVNHKEDNDVFNTCDTQAMRKLCLWSQTCTCACPIQGEVGVRSMTGPRVLL